jgi:hypothetical protein
VNMRRAEIEMHIFGVLRQPAAPLSPFPRNRTIIQSWNVFTWTASRLPYSSRASVAKRRASVKTESRLARCSAARLS